MTSLSTRTKEATKTGLAIVIVYWIAMQMGWDKPYWAGLTVVTINMMSPGVSLTRGVARSLGTLVGAVAGLAIIGLVPQERWWLMLCVSLYVGFCTYMLKGKHQSYFWFLASFTCLLVIGVNSPPESQSAFQTAVLRTQETALGALVYTLVAVFIWPRSSVGALNNTACALWATQTQLVHTYRDLMFGKGTAQDPQGLRSQEIQKLTQVGQLLSAAEIDSYEVWEVRHQWRRFHHLSTELMATLERWRQTFAEIQPLKVTRLLPNWDAVSAELELRFEQIAHMLAHEAPTRTAQAITLSIDHAEMRLLTRFEEAAVVVTRSQLDNLERLSRALFDCVANFRGYAKQTAAPAADRPSRPGPSLDPDRLGSAARVVVTVWIAFFLWVYVNPPGHSTFVMMAGIFALIIAMVPQASASLLFLSWGGGIAFAGVLYIFVMPHLSGFAELAVLVFGAFFVMYNSLAEPGQTVARMFTMASFLVLISIENQQSYSFSDYANDVAWIMLSLTLAVATNYIPTSPRPEKVFLRLLRRFLRNSAFLIARGALDGEREKGRAWRWNTVLFRTDLPELSRKLAGCGKQIDYRMFADHTSGQVQALVTSLYALAYRFKDLIEARGYPQAELVQEHLRDEFRAWREFIEERFLSRAHDAACAVGPPVDMRDRLAARLARLEERIDQTLAQAGEGQLSTEDYRNLYRLLGSYRGLSEAATGYGQLADGFNWAQWQEARF